VIGAALVASNDPEIYDRDHPWPYDILEFTEVKGDYWLNVFFAFLG